MVLGIDVSKSTLDVALLSEGTKPLHRIFSNDAAGHAELLSWLSGHRAETVHACLEATGTWAVEAAVALSKAGHSVSLVNPARIHAFGKSQLKRTKTDKADAILIAQFCQMQSPPLWMPHAHKSSNYKGLIDV